MSAFVLFLHVLSGLPNRQLLFSRRTLAVGASSGSPLAGLAVGPMTPNITFQGTRYMPLRGIPLSPELRR